MQETVEARLKVLEYKNKENISYEQLSLMSGYPKPDIHGALTGRIKTPRANQIILKLIQMFGLA